jgi:5-methylthioadenosine/S-adenosylhomocysteine deaminase
MLRGGTTCFNDMYFHPDVVADRAQRAGIRACVGLIVLDLPTAWAADGGEYINRGLAIHDRVRSDLIETAFAPHAPYTVSDETLRRVRVLADELDIPVQMHVHETSAEIEESVARYGRRPLERLADLGLLTPRLQAVHMTHLHRQEIAAVAAAGVHVVHCPQSNLKLASGLAEVQAMLDAGVNVAIGTDGAASNNDLDMLEETRTAALMAKGRSGDPTALPADRALRAATLGGALAMGVAERIGSIEPGKEADLVAIDLSGIESRPVYDVASAIVYSGGSTRVSDVWVAGRHVLDGCRLTTIDTDGLIRSVGEWGDRIGA